MGEVNYPPKYQQVAHDLDAIKSFPGRQESQDGCLNPSIGYARQEATGNTTSNQRRGCRMHLSRYQGMFKIELAI